MTAMQKTESQLYRYGLIPYCSVTDDVQRELFRLNKSDTFIRIWRRRNNKNGYYTDVFRIEFNV